MAGADERRAPLVSVAATACAQRLRPGEVKRCMARRDPLVGYHLACPGCGFVASYLDSDVGYVEEPAFPGTQFPKVLLGFTRAPCCYRCRRELTVEGRELVARLVT